MDLFLRIDFQCCLSNMNVFYLFPSFSFCVVVRDNISLEGTEVANRSEEKNGLQ